MATDSKDFKVKNGLQVSGDGVFGGTISAATPTLDGHVATKFYVDQFSGGGSITVGDTPPTTPAPVEGDLWYNSTDGSTYVYYDSFWVETSSAYAGPTGVVDAQAPLAYDPQTDILTIDLSSYYTSGEVDTVVATAISNLVDSAPDLLNTLDELAAALGDDPNFVTTINTSLSALEQRVTDIEMMMMMEAM